jgi:hypothetical protein
VATVPGRPGQSQDLSQRERRKLHRRLQHPLCRGRVLLSGGQVGFLEAGKRLLHRLLQRRLLAGVRGVGDRAVALVLARVARGGIEIRVPRPAQAIYDMMQMPGESPSTVGERLSKHRAFLPTQRNLGTHWTARVLQSSMRGRYPRWW